MATFTRVSLAIPSAERVTRITGVEAGDQIDLVDILGRPARGLQITTSSANDVVEYRLNNLIKKYKKPTRDRVEFTFAEKAWGVYDAEPEETWSKGDSFPLYSSTGEVIETVSGLKISSIEIESLTLVSGSTVEIVAW